MADPAAHPTTPSELSPYQQFVYQRIVKTAVAAHGLDTSQWGQDGCAPSVSGILRASAGYEFSGPSKTYVPTIYEHAIKGHMKQTGELDAKALDAWKKHEDDPKHVPRPDTPTPGAAPGNLAVWRDGGKPIGKDLERHIGFVSKVEHGVVTEVLSNGSTAEKFVRDLVAVKRGDTSLTFYEIPVTPKMVEAALKSPAPSFDKTSRLSGACEIVTTPGSNVHHSPDLTPTKPGSFADHHFDRADATWKIAGNTVDGGRLSPETEFKNLTVAEGIFQAKHGREFDYSFKASRGDDPKAITMQNEILHRAVLSNLPPKLQEAYAHKVGLKDAVTSAELERKTGPLEPNLERAALNTINAAVIDAKKLRTDIPDFVPETRLKAPPSQVERINSALHAEVARHLPPELRDRYQQSIDARSAPGTPAPDVQPEGAALAASTGAAIRRAPDTFHYRGHVEAVDPRSGTFVVVSGRNGNQAFSVPIAAVGGQAPENGALVDVRLQNGIGTVTPVPSHEQDRAMAR